MTERCCPACGAAVADERGLKSDLPVCACRGCGTLYARGVSGAGPFYDYGTYYDEASLSVPPFIDRRLDEIVEGFEPFRQTSRLLDIGCGAGALLRAARRAGWDAAGTEVSRRAAEHVRGQGFEVSLGELTDARFPGGGFDVVTAIELLEHLPEPRVMVAEIARVLRRAGLFWGTTPHGRGLSARALGLEWSAIDPPEHLQLFSLGGLRGLLRDAGFGRVRLSSHGFHQYELRQALRRRWSAGAGGGDGVAAGRRGAGFDRVQAAYRLNETLMRSRTGRLTKAALNRLLSAARAGDSITFWAVE